jgi:tetraacyldisaccharide 4'-kinase
VSLPGGVYGAAIGVRNRLYDGGFLRARKLAGPVVSVGNISAGGAGKTPFVILLGELLKQRGVGFDVLSRGYGRSARGVRCVDPNGSAEEFGDEPLLIARRLKCPVVVGESRYEAGALAEKKLGPQLHILDDGFQHRSLARDLDIVLVTLEDLKDDLLPTGRLREPLKSLNRADVVVMSGDFGASVLPVSDKPVWRIRRDVEISGAPARPVVFCGIARPKRFLEQLRSKGINSVAEKVYRDHHAYLDADIDELLRLKTQSNADGFITTEKDWLNLGQRIARLGTIATAKVTMEIVDPADALDAVLRAIYARRQRT